MNQEHRYSLTRVCLRRGELSLPRSLRGVFAPGATVEATDSVSGTTHELQLEDDRVLRGMAPFFQEHELDVNDVILIRPGKAGTVTLTPQKREARPDYSSSQSAERIISTVLDAGPVTEAEARALLSGLPNDFDLAGLLGRSGRLALKGGRWHEAGSVADKEFDRQVDEALTQAGSGSMPETQDVSGQDLSQESPQPVAAIGQAAGPQGEARLLAQVGFQVEQLGDGFLLLDSAPQGSSGRGFRVVLHRLQPGVRLDWASLLERRRQYTADYLAVVGPEDELANLKAPAELAHATLWSETALERLEEIALNLPLGPVDLESHFRHDGMTGQGLERFERTVRERIAERGAFSTVLFNLAQAGGPVSFRLEDAARGVDRDAAARVLDQLSRSPFQLVVRREGGEWHLRQSVPLALAQLAEYASSLQEHFPRSSRTPLSRSSRLQRV